MEDFWNFHRHFIAVLGSILGCNVSVQSSEGRLSAVVQSQASVICPIRVVEADMEDLIKDLY